MKKKATKQTKINKVNIVVILDRSGSMATIQNDAIGGFNTFLAEQKKSNKKARITCVQFDDVYDVLYTDKPIAEAPELTSKTFVPRGSTALHDAIGKTINSSKFDAKKEKVVFLIITDGEENASKEWDEATLNPLITKQQDAGWQFVFIGSNQNAIMTAKTLGINAANALSASSSGIGTQSAYASVTRNLTNYSLGATQDMNFLKVQQDEQDELKKLKGN